MIEAVNQISSTQKSALEKTLLELSLKDQKDLRKLYRQRLKDGPPEDSKGAGQRPLSPQVDHPLTSGDTAYADPFGL